MAVRVSAAALVVFVLAGCGAHALSRRDYLARANAMCVTFTKQLNAIPITKLDDKKTQKHINALAQRLSERLKALKPPSSLRAARDRWFAAIDDEQRLVRRIGHGKASFVTTKSQAAQLDAAQTKVVAAARALGATKCASKR